MKIIYLVLVLSTTLLVALPGQITDTLTISSDSIAESGDWDVNNPPGEYKEHLLTNVEGTWMNLDVSPDGSMIAFDLIGDIFTMPISGGKATALRTGLAYETQPRWSPDGSQIAFTSDAGGGDNIWIMQADGSEAKQVTKEEFRLLNNAAWTPDGNYIIARKHFTSGRSLGAGEMWMYHISGGSGIQLTKRKNDQQDVNEPCVSPDGRFLYYSEDMYPGGFFQYNKDPNDEIYAIKRYDFETGENKKITGGPGSAFRPQISRDGNTLAFIRRVRAKTVLFIRDLISGKEYPIYDKLSKDQIEAWAIYGPYTGYSWMPDHKHILIWAGGHIHKINIDTKSDVIIPFKTEVTHRFQKTVQFKQQVDTDKVDVNVIRQLTSSPDGKQVIFNAVGHLYKAPASGGNAKRLTDDTHFEFEPVYTADGQSIYYTTWDDAELGAIYTVDISSGNKQKITKEPGIYREINLSPDNTLLIYRKAKGNGHQGFSYTTDPGIYILDLASGEHELISDKGAYPEFSADGQSIYYQTGGYLFGAAEKTLERIRLKDRKKTTLFKSKHANRYIPSPDGKWLAFSELHNVYITAFPDHGQTIDLTKDMKNLPVEKVTRDAGINIHWSADSKNLHWTLGNEYFTESLTDRFDFLPEALDSLPAIDTTGVEIRVDLKTDRPDGLIALVGARIITMDDNNRVIENGAVLIENNKIKALGAAGEVKIPRRATVIKVDGKTIMPGLIDVHAHLGAFRFGQSPQQHWQYWANLAYGVTTTHDPSSNSEMTFSQSEMVKAGVMVGPRIYTTGTILYGAEGDFKAPINSLEDAMSALRRTKAYGAFSVKSYNQPRRNQRQQIIEAARQLEIMVYPEGGSFFFHNMSMIADGHTSVEHNIPVAPLHADVIEFWKKTKTANTPTLIVNYGGLNGEYYWYDKTDVWAKDHLLHYTPRAVVDSRSRHRNKAPEEEYEIGHILTAASCAKLQENNVNICLGSHGQLQGLGAHWELWMFTQGGMSNMQALRSATIQGAEYIGMEDEIGSLEPGKLADLIVIDGNPLEDIQQSENVTHTMINGRLYETSTMNEVGLRSKTRKPFYWEREGSGNAWPFNENNHSHMAGQCGCGH